MTEIVGVNARAPEKGDQNQMLVQMICGFKRLKVRG